MPTPPADLADLETLSSSPGNLGEVFSPEATDQVPLFRGAAGNQQIGRILWSLIAPIALGNLAPQNEANLPGMTANYRGLGNETLSTALAAIIGAGALTPVDEGGTAVTIGTATNGKHLILTSTGSVALTLDPNASQYTHVRATPSSGTYTVTPGGSAGYFTPHSNFGGSPATAAFILSGQVDFLCLSNPGSAARWLIVGQTSLQTVLAAILDAAGFDILNIGSGSTFENAASTRAALAIPEVLILAVSDESTNLSTGTAKLTFRMPFAMTVSAVRASVKTAPVGSTIIVDINEGATPISILGTKLSIDANEKTSTTAASAATITDSALADDAEMTIDIDQIGSTTPGAGLKVQIHGVRA